MKIIHFKHWKTAVIDNTTGLFTPLTSIYLGPMYVVCVLCVVRAPVAHTYCMEQEEYRKKYVNRTVMLYNVNVNWMHPNPHFFKYRAFRDNENQLLFVAIYSNLIVSKRQLKYSKKSWSNGSANILVKVCDSNLLISVIALLAAHCLRYI